MNDITFDTLINNSWMKTTGDISEAKSIISKLKSDLSRQEQRLIHLQQEFEYLKRFHADYVRPFDDADEGDHIDVDSPKVAPVETTIKVDIADIAQSIADDFIARLRDTVDTIDEGAMAINPNGDRAIATSPHGGAA